MLSRSPLVVLCSLMMIAGTVGGRAQTRGRVRMPDGSAIPDVHVSLPGLRMHTVTDSNGLFRFTHVPDGRYAMAFSHIGFASLVRSVRVPSEADSMIVVMNPSPLDVPAVVVTAEPQPTSVMESPQQVSVVEGRDLDLQRGQALMASIAMAPGVSISAGGPMTAKPVIRGLTSQRVVVAQQGLRWGTQTWDDPQSVEMSAFDVERIEIVRGPSSLMYGSDALGGVANVIRRDVMATPDGTVRGQVQLSAHSVNTGIGGAIDLEGASSDMAYRVQANGRTAGDYSSPAGAVFNSGATEFGAVASAGLRIGAGTVALDLSHLGQLVSIAPEPGRREVEIDPVSGMADTLPASPIQEIMHERVGISAVLPMPGVQLDVTGAMQYNSRIEEGITESESEEEARRARGIPPEIQLDLYTTTLLVKGAVHGVGTAGLQVEHQRQQTLGRKAVIPGFQSLNLSASWYSEFDLAQALRITGSARIDHRSMDALANAQLGTPDTSLTYDAVAGQLGLAWQPIETLVLAATLGSGWRAPVAAELFGNGKDEGSIRYKIGSPGLVPERATNLDVSMRYDTPTLRAEASVFRTSIRNFIALQPTTLVVDGLPAFRFQASDALMLGGELWVQARPWSAWTVQLGVDVVYTERATDGTALPFMPANRCKGAITYSPASLLGLARPYISVRPRYVVERTRVAINEQPTPSYATIDVALGGELFIAQRNVLVDLIVENCTNTRYADALSRYRAFALDPGLNVALKVRLPFIITS